MTRVLVTGTDTGIGKTVFAAALAGAMGASYWKPVQAGLQEETDSEIVARLSGCRVLSEAWRLSTPVSPHLAAELDDVQIDPAALELPAVDGPLVIEGAGGLMVPLTRGIVFADVFTRWKLPAVLCARTALGTINHTLLSLEALRARSIPVHGIAFIGDPMEDSERTIQELSGVRRLGRLPWLNVLNRDTLARAFADNFDIRTFQEPFR
ncbi:dethiobiotin synthase [Terrihabitans sp. B22-R8]|uniref:dethiobiotin synthase n=1 Tax=Terrihabitans sp. B22-R8 TaxID=3425128 RepID=UPI00403C56B6